LNCLLAGEPVAALSYHLEDSAILLVTALSCRRRSIHAMESTAHTAELIPPWSPSDGAVTRLDIALQRRLDLRSQILRQPPACLDDESSDARTRR
jgi:hypothetical protein